MPKVYMLPKFGHESGQGGIKRVVEKMEQLLPAYGIEFVDDLNKADLISLHGTETISNPKVPTILNCHGLYWSNPNYTWPSWAIKANSILVNSMKHAKAVTVPSQFVANSVRRGTLIDPYVVPHGVDIDEWQPQKSREDYVIWAKNRVDPICDAREMNRLAAMATDVKFVSTFGQATDNVFIIGAKPLQEIKPYIQNASLMFAPTRETGSITVLESLASGVPVLGWRWGATAEIVESRVTGWLSEPGDWDDLFVGLQYCKAHLKELSVAAREAAVSKFQWKDVIGKYADVYNFALQQPTPGPKVSVIVTAHNLESYLPTCIGSVLNQDYNDWELWIVDDFSPDGCGRLADEYASKDLRIKVIHNPQNLYLAESRNVAIRQAKGRYILPLDADDQVAPGALKTLAESLDRDPEIDIATGAMELVEPDGRRWISTWPPANPNFNEQIAQHNQVPYASMYRKEIWDRVGGYRRRMKTAEDAEFWTRVMSMGAVPAKVTNNPTLIYSNRPNSMSHLEAPINWTDWFPWSKFPELTPYAASGEPPRDSLFWDVNSYGPIEVSVVIPVGPGHDWYLQDALDSLVAQTFLNWECILINDTGSPWLDGDRLINPYLQGFPFAKVLDSDGTNHGVAWARTQGTLMAKAPLVFYLDADDYLQPLALDAFVKTQKQYGGWIYSDWYDQDGQIKEAKDWSADGLVEKMLGPMTGLYPRDHMLAVLFEDFGGWEDWDAQLSLLERGVCGTHLAYPLFTYRYHTGTRREDNFEKATNLLQYVRNKHQNLLREEVMAGCRSCGGGGGKPKASLSVSAGKKATGSPDLVLIEYVGPMTQFQRFKSKAKAGTNYRFGGNPGAESRKFFIYKEDANWVLANPAYRVVPEVIENQAIPDVPVLTAHTRPAPVDFNDFMKSQTPSIIEQAAVPMEAFQAEGPASIDLLQIAPESISILKTAGFDTVEQLKTLSVAQLVTIKGIGATRAAKIMKAAKEF